MGLKCFTMGMSDRSIKPWKEGSVGALELLPAALLAGLTGGDLERRV